MINSRKRVTGQYTIQKGCGLQMMLEKLEDGTCRKPIYGHSDSLVKMSHSPESKKELNEEQGLDSFMKLCVSSTKRKKIDPNGLYVKMLKICYLLTEDEDSLKFSLKWGGGLGAKTGLYTFVDINKKGSVQTTDTARTLLARYNKGQPNRTAECSGVLESDEPIRIRRLTPKECFRLQGFTDEQFDRAAAVNSETQLYKQAGNAVTVNVVEEIGRHIKEVVTRLN